MSATPISTVRFGQAARAMRGLGWSSALPLPYEQKKSPPVGYTGAEGRLPTDEDYNTWDAQVGDYYNIAVVMPPNVVGMDVDVRDGKRGDLVMAEATERLGDLPPTYSITARGADSISRIYLYRRDRTDRLRGFLGGPADGVEIIQRTHRYIVGPGSVHPDGGTYTVYDPSGQPIEGLPAVEDLALFPDAWEEDLAPTNVRATSDEVATFTAGLVGGDHDEDTQGLLDEFDRRLNDEDGWGRFTDSGSSQDAMLRITMDLAIAGACGVPGVAAALAAAEDIFVTYRVSRGDSLRDAAGAWRRALAGAIGYVRENGIVPLEPFEVPADIAGAHRRPAKRQKPSLRELILRRGDLARLPRPEPLIEDTLDLRTVALLAGYHGTYKSFVALSWTASVATGTRWMGRSARQGRVLYIVGEGATGIDNRLAAWEEANGVRIDDDALHTLPVAVQLADPAALREVLGYVEEVGFSLVVIDTVARAAVGLEENSSKDMGVFVQAADDLRRAMDTGTVLLVHHTGKDKTTVRGSSAVEAAMDTVYTTEGGDGLVKLRRTKRKDGPMEDTHQLLFEQVGPSGVLVSTKPTEAPAVALDKRAGAYQALHATFGYIGSFTGTKAEETLRDRLGVGRTAARERIAELARDNFIKVEKVGRSHVYHLQNDDAVKQWGTVVLHTEDRAENCVVDEQKPERPPAPGVIVREDDGTTYVVEANGTRREATEDEVAEAARTAVQRLLES
ncbi:AAA family ATPase [Geodermatophilus sp. URMC 62]|uniref:AAA family ATPase n=1 Tax=Geodermatophilus sp. URMC 62 TaxID=3423414 RepID=UPI00406C7010